MAEAEVNRDETGRGRSRARPVPRPVLLGVVLIPLALLVFSCSGCSPIYLAKAGWTEMKILRGRRPFNEVIADPGTPEETRRKILLTRQARAFAIHMLGLDAGDSYTSFTQLESDTLAWVLSAAYKDRLEAKTWWFPIVGRVPYKGYGSKGSAEKAERKLQNDGFDTYLRTTSAFSTLGWFADPLLSSLLRLDDVELVSTIIHELSHNHLFVKGQVRFNESFATFVGRTGAIRFFCGLEGGVPAPECELARGRWEDYQDFSVRLESFVNDLTAIYSSADMDLEEKIRGREDLFESAREEFDALDLPSDASPLWRGFLNRPLNNATLLARMRYFHHLPAFQALLDHHEGDLRAAVATLAAGAPSARDPFDLLPG